MNTYILITAVLCIWGIIGYKILTAVSPTPKQVALENFNMPFNPKANTKTDSFSVQLLERDPFLGTISVKKPLVLNKVKPKVPIAWLPVIYHGNISNQDDKIKVFIISIDNEQYLMRLGEEIKGVKLIKGSSSSIIMQYKRDRKTILKT